MKKLVILALVAIIGLTQVERLLAQSPKLVRESATESVKELSPVRSADSIQPASNDKLKRDVSNLVADARAGKLKMPASQKPSATQNNLTKTQTIAIVAVAVVVIALVATHVISFGKRSSGFGL